MGQPIWLALFFINPKGTPLPVGERLSPFFIGASVKIPITTAECELVKKLLNQHVEGETRPYFLCSRLPYGSHPKAAMVLAGELFGNPNCLCIDGDQRLLVLFLVALAAAGERAEETAVARHLLERLQPEGRPVGAVLGDFVVDKSTGELVELYHFSFDDERCCVTESTSYFIFASANSSKGG
jgi:hypothetical protein